MTAPPVTPPPHASSRGLWVGLALGAPLIAYGVRGALVDSALTHPAELARWILGAAIVHDVLLAPVAVSVGCLARRFLPAPAWPAGRWALAATAILVLVAFPLVRGYGRNGTIPSLLARDYGLGLVAAIATVWGIALALALWNARRGRE